MNPRAKKKRCWVITPTYLDHASTFKLLEKIDELDSDYNFIIVVVDDSSPIKDHDFIKVKNFVPKKSILSKKIIELNQNFGNQGAIAVGLHQAFIQAKSSDLFVVMDSDGEDSPASILSLLEALKNQNDLAVAKRAKRKSNLMLALWHTFFKLVMKILTGKILDFGNFSAFSYEVCKKIVSNRKLSISFVGCLLQSEFNVLKVKTLRGERYFGSSQTNRDGLLIWGFTALTVFSDKIFVKLIRIGVFFGLSCFFGILAIILMKLTTDLAVPGWSGVMVTILISSCLQLIILLSGFVMIQTQIKSQNLSYDKLRAE